VTELAEPTQARASGILERRGDSPLSVEQEYLWFLQVAQQHAATTYNVSVAWHLDGPLDRPSLEAALADVVRRHAVLRTCFLADAEGRARVLVTEPRPFPLRTVDLTQLDREARSDALARCLREEARSLFDVEREPPVRAALLSVEPGRHVLVWTANELVFDRPSVRLLGSELARRYRLRATGTAWIPGDVPCSYADYAAQQREWCRGPEAAAMLGHWKETLEGYGGIELPFEQTYSYYNRWLTSDGDLLALPWPVDLVRGLEQLARLEGTEPLVVLQAAYAALLHRHSGQPNFALGLTVDGRPDEAREVIGNFESLLPVRIDLAGDPTFADVVRRTRRAVETARANARVPAPLITETVRPESRGEAPLLLMTTVALGEPLPALDFGDGLVARPQLLHDSTARLDLSIELESEESSARALVEHSTKLLSRESVERLVERLALLLRAALAEPGHRVSELPLATPEEIRLAVEGWNETALPDAPATIVERFDAKASELAERTAVRDETGTELSYAELRRQANRLAHHLLALGVKPEDRCALFLDRTALLVVAALGVLKAGAAYVPLDPETPSERLTAILDDAGAAVVVTEDALAGLVPAGARRLVRLDGDACKLDAASSADPAVALAPESLAYVMYTSGSTGAPKGVLVEHRAVCAFVRGAQELYGLTSHDRLAHVASPAFDVSTFDFFGSLITGARLSIAGSETRRSVERLRRFLREEGTTVYMGTPGLLELLDPADFPELRLLAIGGEAFSGEFATRWGASHRLLNSYGPTETTVAVIARFCEGEWDATPPIGLPMPNHRAYVLDERHQPLPSGATGELYVGGPGVARGYLGRPGSTAAAFVPDPFGPAGERLYCTGDLVRRLPSGELVFLGRADRQVKISGVRIELGEIETALRRHPGVEQVAALAEPSEHGPPKLVAYVVPRGRAPSVTSLRASVASWLPPNMIPNEFVELDRIPLTPQGKLDRAALAEARQRQPVRDGQLAPPRTETERRVADEILKPVLELDEIGVDDNFFELGGHSLQVLNVLSRVRSIFGVEIRVTQFFQVPTLAGIAAVIDGTAGADEDRPDRELLLQAIEKVEGSLEPDGAEASC